MRLQKTFILSCILLLIGITTKAQEIRGGVEWKKNLAPTLETEFKFQLRNNLKNTTRVINHSILQANIAYEPIKNIGIGGSVRYTSGMKEGGSEQQNKYSDKYRLTADISYKTNKLKSGNKISNRLRYQHSRIESDDEKQSIRNKLKYEYRLTKMTIPYMAIEPFYSLSEKEFQALRIYLGSEFELIKNKIDVFLIIELKSRKGNPFSNQILGLCYKI